MYIISLPHELKLVQQIEQLRAEYMREDLPEYITADSVNHELHKHADTRDAIDKDYAETVAMGKALIERMQLPPLHGEGGKLNRPQHILEELLDDLEDRKIAWKRVWQDREDRLHHWFKLGDYEKQMGEVWKYSCQIEM